MYNKLIQLILGDQNKEKRSISENNKYPAFCLRAAKKSNVFKNFRANSVYNEILEHVTEEQGLIYLEEIKKMPQVLKHLNRFKENDLIGGPKLFNYEEYGLISPTTLRYIKVLCDLISQFNSLDNFNIYEIGVGYGGQCRIIDEYSKIPKYVLIDLLEVLLLSERYLKQFEINSKIEFKEMEALNETMIDLVISNYAFSELTRAMQDFYLNKVILKSKNGYITYNEINPESFNSYKLPELLSIIPNSFIVEEVPLTHPQNAIIVWKEKR